MSPGENRGLRMHSTQGVLPITMWFTGILRNIRNLAPAGKNLRLSEFVVAT